MLVFWVRLSIASNEGEEIEEVDVLVVEKEQSEDERKQQDRRRQRDRADG